ncbi:MAG: hypothetical protein ABI347_04050 [Nitrososphaera sp.]
MNALGFTFVFADLSYVALAVAIAAGFWVLFAILDQLMFLSPVFAFYIPSDAYAGLALSTVTAALLGVVIAMNVHVFRHSTVKIGSSIFSSSALSVLPSACAGCTSAGFFLASAFGVAGATAASALAEYQLPMRLAGLALVGWAYYSVNKRVMQACDMVKP